MIRSTAFWFAACLAAPAVMSVASCGPSAPPPGGMNLEGSRNTDSPIAGATLRCQGDYPDSVLVFAPDGTLSGRYAGRQVSGEWTAVGPERVEVMIRAGGIAVRDTMRRTGAGWRGDNTACG
jgi:hypothetical protein